MAATALAASALALTVGAVSPSQAATGGKRHDLIVKSNAGVGSMLFVIHRANNGGPVWSRCVPWGTQLTGWHDTGIDVDFRVRIQVTTYFTAGCNPNQSRGTSAERLTPGRDGLSGFWWDLTTAF